MKILIVDDDFVSRTKMKTILKGIGSCTDEEHAANAVKIFEQALGSGQPFDLITLDIHMPDMDGTEVLYRIRQMEKDTPDAVPVKIFMVTSHSDKDSLITCLQAGCDGFIVKPFTHDTLLSKLKTSGLNIEPAASPQKSNGPDLADPPVIKRKSLIQEVSEALQEDQVNLPSLPDINTRLKEMVQKRINVSEISGLLKKDMLITSSLISLSNSALFRGIEKNRTLEEAISRLGIDQTYNHVEMLCQRALYSDVPKKYSDYVEKLWLHAQACAYASQYAADHLKLNLTEDPFTLGLVHDIGRLILLQIISKLEQVGPTGDDVDPKILYSTLDAHHGDFGAALLKKWGFSDIFALVAKYHDCVETVDTPPKELLLVSLINVLVHNLNKPTDQLLNNPTVEFCVKNLSLLPKAIEDIRQNIAIILNDIVH